MRVLLVSSYTMDYVTRIDISPPVSLLGLAAVLREGGHEPHILDLDLVDVPDGETPEVHYIVAIHRAIDDVRPGMVGINCLLSAHFPFVREAAGTIGEAHPGLPVAIGGIHPTLFAAEILQHVPAIDAIALGEGEIQAVALADAYEQGAGLAHIDALAFRGDDGQPVVNPRQTWIKELDTLPDPAWDLVRLEDYFTDHSSWYNPRGLDIRLSVPILTSRSCPYDCNFCSAHTMMGRGLRRRSPARVVDEMQRLIDSHGMNYFGFVDDNLTLHRRHILDLCNEIVRRGLVIQFESFNGYNLRHMNEEIIDAMVEAGCVNVILPIEHGSDHMRNAIIGKKLERDRIFEIAELYKQRDLLTRAVFIMGFPEDTAETLADTERMILELGMDMNSVFNLIPFPGTKIFDQAMRDGLFIHDIDPAELWKGTLDLNALQSQFYIQPYDMTLEQLADFRERFDQIRFQTDRIERLQRQRAADADDC